MEPWLHNSSFDSKPKEESGMPTHDKHLCALCQEDATGEEQGLSQIGGMGSKQWTIQDANIATCHQISTQKRLTRSFQVTVSGAAPHHKSFMKLTKIHTTSLGWRTRSAMWLHLVAH